MGDFIGSGLRFKIDQFVATAKLAALARYDSVHSRGTGESHPLLTNVRLRLAADNWARAELARRAKEESRGESCATSARD